MNKLVVISAPSGAGKTTLCNRLLKDLAGKLVLSVSSTTRLPRGTEKDGIEYHFLSEQDFKKGIDQGEFAEWALVHGNYYGTSNKTIEDAFRKGLSVLLEIDVQGADSLKKAFPDRNVRVFVAPPSMEELEKRLRSRGTDSEATIQHRLDNAREEMARKNEFERIIVNDDLERAYQELKQAVEKALHG